MGSTSDEFYRFQSVQTTGGSCSCEAVKKPPFSGSSDQPCVDTGTFTRGLSTGGTVGGTGSGLYRLPVGHVPVKLSRNPPSVVPVISPVLILEPSPEAFPLVGLLGVPVPVCTDYRWGLFL